MATLYLDFSGGNDSNDATSFANRVKTITSGITAARTAPGDTIRMMKSEDPVSLGINATFTKGSDTITLASALTKNVDLCEGAWTAVGANVTQSNPTTRKEGSKSIQFAVGASFTTGQIAYLTMASTDFSAYTKLSFWIRTSIAVSSGALKIQLCSDTVGATPVDTFTINEATNANSWRCITIDKGSALGAAIQSVSFDAISDPGTVNIQLDDIQACNNLTLTCLLSLSSSATAMDFYPIKSINGTTVKIDQGVSHDASATARGYEQATATATCYKREPIRIAALQSTQEAGTAASVSTYSGGWDTTNMTSQTGLTFIDLGDNSGSLVSFTSSYLQLEKMVVVRGSNAFNFNTSFQTITNCGFIGASNIGINTNSNNQTFTSCRVLCCGGNGVSASSYNQYFNSLYVASCGINGVSAGTSLSIFSALEIYNNASNGIANANNGSPCIYTMTSKDNAGTGAVAGGGVMTIYSPTTSGNGGNGLNASLGFMYADNTSCTDSAPFTASGAARLQLSRIGGDPAVARIYCDANGATICAQIASTPVHGSSTKSWQHIPQSNHTSAYPLWQRLNPVAVASSGTLTFSIWARRDSTNVGGQLFLRGGQSNGVANNLTAAITASANTWEQLTITCSPTQAVPLVFEFQSWQISGSGNIYFGDATVSQA
jgi:hypothetical protein